MAAVILIYILEGLFCAAIGMPSASVESCNTVSLLLLFVNALVMAVYLSKRYKKYERAVLTAMLFSLLLKVLLILWDYYGVNIFVLPNSHSDSESYHWMGISFARYGLRVENYSYLVGMVYRFFGIQRMTAQYLNVIFSFIGISYLARTLEILGFEEAVQNKTLRFAAFLPNYLIISSILIRECIISMILSISLYSFSRWWKKNKTTDLLLSMLISLGACYFHPGAVAVTIGIAAILIISKPKPGGGRKLNISIKSVVLALVFFSVFMFLFDEFSDSIFHKFGGMTIESIDNYIEDHNFYNGQGNDSSKYYAGVEGYTGITGILINSPIRMVYFLWVPMPWDMRGIGDIIAFFGSSLFYGGSAFAGLYYLLRKNKNNDKTFLVVTLMIALVGAFVFAWGTDSAGSALRHREKFYFAYLLLFASLQEYKNSAGVGSSRRQQSTK